MEPTTSSSIVATNLSESWTEPRPRAPREKPRLWRYIIRSQARLSDLLSGLAIQVVILGIGVSLAVSWLTSQGNFDPSTWLVSRYLNSLGQHLFVAVGVLGTLGSVAFIASRGTSTEKSWNDAKKAWEKQLADWEARKAAWEKRIADENAEKQREEKIVAAVKLEAARGSATNSNIAAIGYTKTLLSQLQYTDCDVESKVTTYIPREADTRASQALLDTAQYPPNERTAGKIGIYVVGQHGIGKSRLVWETLDKMREEFKKQDELKKWTFMHYPSPPGRPFPFESIKEGDGVIILVDRLENYASLSDPRAWNWLNHLPEDAGGKVRLIVVATLRDSYDRKVRERLGPLLSRLDPVEVGGISSDDVQQLEKELLALDRPLHEWDGITPGSIIDGSATRETYEHLSVDAQDVLKVLRLLDSAGFGPDTRITKARVSAVADAVFDRPRLRWRAACDELIKQQLIYLTLIAPSYVRAIVARDRDVLKSVGDYPLNDYPLSSEDSDIEADERALPYMEIEDWPLLYEIFKEKRDDEALVTLGIAWWNSLLPFRPDETSGLPTKLDYLNRAADCFRTALDIRAASPAGDPSTQARVRGYLADVLLGLSTEMLSSDRSPTRLDVLQEAASIYQEVRKYNTDTTDPNDRDLWIRTTASLAGTFNERTKFLDGVAKTAQLVDAAVLVRTALDKVDEQASAEAKIYCKSTLADIRLHQAQIAETREEAARFLAEAYNAADDALRLRQESDPEAIDKVALAWDQGKRSYVLRFRASLASGEERMSLLKQSKAALDDTLDALSKAVESREKKERWLQDLLSTDVRMWLQALKADILLQLARATPTAGEVQDYLSEAEDLCSNIIDTPAKRNVPRREAWVRGVYGGILAELIESSEEWTHEDGEYVLDEALEQCDAAREVPNRESAPEDWAGTRLNTALLLLRRAQQLEPDRREDARSALQDARKYLDEALTVYSAPLYAAEHQQALALVEQIEQYATIWSEPLGPDHAARSTQP